MKIEHSPQTTIKTEHDENQIESIYFGFMNNCRCGCGGEYINELDNERDFYYLLHWFRIWNKAETAKSFDGYIFEIELSYKEFIDTLEGLETVACDFYHEFICDEGSDMETEYKDNLGGCITIYFKKEN